MTDTDKIQYDLDLLSSKVTELGNIEKNLSDIKRSLRQLADMADSFWEGDAVKSFKSRVDNTSKKLQGIKETVNKNKLNLRDSISLYQKTEDSNTGEVNDLSTDNIF